VKESAISRWRERGKYEDEHLGDVETRG